MSVREAGKQGEDFRRDEVFGSVKALVDKGDIDALLKNDITGTGTTPLEDISKNHPEFANLSYANLGIDPTGIDLNGDGVINENELALLSNSDREKIIKADPNILADYVTRKVAQSHMGGKKYFDEQNPKEDKPKMSADELIEKYSAMEDVAKDVGVTPDAAVDNLRDEKRSALPFTGGTGAVKDSLRNIQSEKNKLEFFQPLENKYNNLLDDVEKERNTKIDSLRDDLNVTRFEAGEFKTQGEYDDAYEKVESEVKKIKEEYRPKISQIQKDYDKEYYSNLPNIDNQIMPQYIEVYDNDVKRYKRGELTFKEMKERYPNIHETDLR